MRPANLSQILARYKDGGNSAISTLRWGGKKFYLMGDPKPRDLNRTSDGWVYADGEHIQEFEIKNNPPDEFFVRTHFSVGQKESDYYPWYYDLTRKPIAIMIDKILPFFKYGNFYDLVDDRIVSTDNDKFSYTLEDIYFYPEFFLPIYE